VYGTFTPEAARFSITHYDIPAPSSARTSCIAGTRGMPLRRKQTAKSPRLFGNTYAWRSIV